MDLYVVDSTWMKHDPIDGFDSLIWTERYNAAGDVTLTLPATTANKALIVEGIFLHMTDSREIMLIDTISIKDGVMTATGLSLVGFLMNRIFRSTWQTTNDAWNLVTNPAGTIINNVMIDMAQPATYLTNGNVLTSAQGTNEKIPNLTLGTAVPGANVLLSVQFGNLYDGIKAIADSDDLGFTMYPPSVVDGTGNLIFQAYRGLDRTTGQTINGQVIFDPALDTLTEIEELRSISGYKNVCWVWPNGPTAQAQVGVAYAPGAAALTSWARRTMMLEASDINVADYTAPNLAIVLAQKGRDALANNNYVRTIDGQIVPQNAFVYGTDYNLGDIVELRGPSDTAQAARITEYIRSQDSTGVNAYPTLSVIS